MKAKLFKPISVPLWLSGATLSPLLYLLLMVALTRYLVPDTYADIRCSQYWVAVPDAPQPRTVDVNALYKNRVWLMVISNTTGYFEFNESYRENLLWGALPWAMLGALAGQALTPHAWQLKLGCSTAVLLVAALYVGATYVLAPLVMALRMDCWMWPN